jgi:subtilisin-like proprotein convertase family protein
MRGRSVWGILLGWGLLVLEASASVSITSAPGEKQFQIFVEGIQTSQVILNQIPHTRVDLLGAEGYQAPYQDLGYPEIPVLRFWVTGRVDVEVREENFIDSDIPQHLDLALAPVQASSSKKKDGSPPPFVKREDVYQKNAFFPSQDFDILSAGTVAGQPQKLVTLYPFKYNPVTQQYRLTSHFVVRVQSPSVQTSPRGPAGPLGILFVVGQQFANHPELEAYIELKRENGLKPQVVVYGQDASTPEELQQTLAHRYRQAINTSSPIKHVVLVGDHGDVPAFTATTSHEHPYTDHYYATLDQDNFLADVFTPDVTLGRISVENDSELRTVLEKFTRYELGRFESPHWLKKASFLATNDANHRTLVESTHNHVIDSHTSGQKYTGNFPTLRILGGDKLYDSLRTSTKNVLDAIQDGRSIINYSGHELPHMWEFPTLTQDHLSQLDNPFSLPMVISNACLTGNFVASSFAQYDFTESLAETWQRHPQGAILFLGSMSYTYWNEDDMLEKRLFDAIFDHHQTVFGEMVHAAKTDTATYYGHNASMRYYWEMYHTFGDPSIRFRTDKSRDLTIVGPTEWDLTSGSQLDYTVVDASNLPVSKAKVSIVSKTGSFFWNGVTDAKGKFQLTSQDSVEPGDRLLVTVTGQNLVRTQSPLNVFSGPGPYLKMNGFRPAGRDSNLVYLGETFILEFNVENLGQDSTQGAVIRVDVPDIQGPVRFKGGEVRIATAEPFSPERVVQEGQLTFEVAAQGLPAQPIQIPLIWETQEGTKGRGAAQLLLGRGMLEMTHIDFGNETGIQPGGEGTIYLTLKNTGNETISQTTLQTQPNSCIQMLSPEIQVPELKPGHQVRLEEGLLVMLDNSQRCPTLSYAVFQLTGTYQNTAGNRVPLATQSSFAIGRLITSHHEYTQLNLNIPNSDASGVTYSWAVDRDDIIEDIRFELFIRHYYIGDLIVTLIHPDGTRAVLWNREGGSEDDIRETFGTGNPRIPNFKALFVGKPMKGLWRLFLQDMTWHWFGWLGNWNTGYLDSIKLSLTGYQR